MVLIVYKESVGDYTLFEWNLLMTSFDGLENLTSIDGDLIIDTNSELSDFCALSALLQNNGLNGSYTISSNGFIPSQQDMIDGNCNQ